MSRAPHPVVSVNDPTLQAWIRAGLLHLTQPGTGNRRIYSPAEVRVLRALDSLRRLAGVSPGREFGHGRLAARRALQLAVAECARANPPGTVHDLPSPAPWLRVVLIVPE